MLIKLVKAFTKDKNQGNPAGVVLDADVFSEEEMQSIASQIGFSETSFIQTSDKADFKVRFFSPIHEEILCGHGTIATFHTLIEYGKIKFRESDKVTVTQETKAGVLSIICHKDGLIKMIQNKPEFFDFKPDKTEIAKLLNIDKEDILEHPLEIVSTGKPKLMIPVNSLEILFKIKPDLEGIKEFCKKSDVRGFYPFTFETKEKDSDIHARQFNPLAGINEDPITGTAAGPLGAYLKHHKLIEKN